MPQAEGQEMPDCHQDGCADQCPENGDTIYVDITNPGEDNDICQQPDTNEGRDDGTDEAEWKSPADQRLCDEADDRRNDQINDWREISQEEAYALYYQGIPILLYGEPAWDHPKGA